MATFVICLVRWANRRKWHELRGKGQHRSNPKIQIKNSKQNPNSKCQIRNGGCAERTLTLSAFFLVFTAAGAHGERERAMRRNEKWLAGCGGLTRELTPTRNSVQLESGTICILLYI